MRTLLLVSVFLLFVAPATAAPPDPAGVAFFEQKIRPVLVKHCYECHSAGKKEKGGLLLDTRNGIRKGGVTGPAVVPGDPQRSLLIKAVRFDGLEMPPKKQLPRPIIADLERWIKMGAPDPRESSATAPPASWEQVLRKRRQWWSLQPVRKAEVPAVKNPQWSAHPVDRFLLARLERDGLQPGQGADRRTLLRRLSLILTGLPPTAEELEAFVRDQSPTAYEKQVDRLLASPHFGERWARHWLDVVRYAETHGNEWNYEVQHAWRYRDYVVRAFNQDVPYDQFVREHIAGDLLPKPRRDPRDGLNESIIGTAFYRFGDGNVEDCIAVPQVAFDVVDNQIDTLGKAFQATTVACARCHDHKLDAVSMKDYYALVGILHSSRQQTHTLDTPETNVRPMQQLAELKRDIRAELTSIWQTEMADMARFLLAAQARLAKEPGAEEKARGLDSARLDRWTAALKANDDLFAPWRAVASAKWQEQAERFAKEEAERTAFNREHYRTYTDFRTGNLAGWQMGGQGLRNPSSPGDFALHHEGDTLLKAVLPAGCFTHTLSDKLNGTLRSPLLPSHAGKKISLEVMGYHHAGATLISHNCQLSDHNYQHLNVPQLGWVTFNLPDDPAALRCYVDLATIFDNPKFPDPIQKEKYKDKENYRVAWDQAAANPRSYFGVTRVVFHDGNKPPQPERTYLRPLFSNNKPANLTEAAVMYTARMKAAIQIWSLDRATDDDVRWIDGLLQRGLLGNTTNLTPRLAELASQYRAVEGQIALPRVIPGMGDFGPGFDQPIFVRGDCARPSERVSRRYLEVLSPPNERFTPSGSGRLELAERIARAENPLTARVMVNRIWQHVYGTGIVGTVDDFGQNGERPSHPELLDYLATRFVQDGWSMKRLIRSLVLTQTFRLTDRPSDKARTVDPQDRLLHHYPAQRMEAEAIRDSILAVSGRLDRTVFGLSVEPFRDREIPHQRLFIGPLDGRGRRSLYVKHTLMEGPKFLEAFNFPKGGITQGRRDVTNVPAQALALLNDPFVLQQAGVWAERLTARRDASPAQRIDAMFQQALGRSASPAERARFETAVRKLAALHGVAEKDVLTSKAVWQDAAHMLFNVKEFIYIP